MNRRRFLDAVFVGQARACLGLVAGLAVLMCAVMTARAWPLLRIAGQARLWSQDWRPSQGHFGLAPFLVASLAVTALAMAVATPLCVLAAAYLSEYAGSRLRGVLRPAIDMMAGVPSVVFGLFGVVAVVPAVGALGRGGPGFSILAAGLVLAVMIIPIILSLSLDVFLAIPREVREAALALGATRDETIRKVLLRVAAPGLVAANILGLARAFGETMAVVMVVGNATRMPRGLLQPACPVPALLANHYGEMMSVPHYDAALLLAALLLLAVVGGASLAARSLLRVLPLGGSLT